MPRSLDLSRIGELAHLDISAAVAQELDAFGPGRGMAGAIHHEIGAESADDLAHTSDALLRRAHLFELYGRLGAEAAREIEPRMFGRADADHAAGAHFLRRDNSQNADRSGSLNDNRVAPVEPTRLLGAIECANAGGQRLGQRAE